MQRRRLDLNDAGASNALSSQCEGEAGTAPSPYRRHLVTRMTRVTRVTVGPNDGDRIEFARTEDAVAEETPIALSYNGIAHVVMMATPRDLEDFAIGFSLSEGIVDSVSQIRDVQFGAAPSGFDAGGPAPGLVVDLTIASACVARLKEKRRSLAGRTGCGICGTESLAMLDLATPRMGTRSTSGRARAEDPCQAGERSVSEPMGEYPSIAPRALLAAFAALHRRQVIHSQTGAVHAAGWADVEGALFCVREDVGRHNALDKLIGALARNATVRPRGFAIVTSRASYEMVQKAARAGMDFLAAISAPTALAIRMAEDAGMTLVGFARQNSFVFYAGGSCAFPLPASESRVDEH